MLVQLEFLLCYQLYHMKPAVTKYIKLMVILNRIEVIEEKVYRFVPW